MAVTSAPAPAPWMINGRGEYLSHQSQPRFGPSSKDLPLRMERDDVIRALERRRKGMIKRIPARTSANALSLPCETHFSNLASTFPLWASITPTYRTTLPSLNASSLKRSISASPSARRSTYSSLLLHPCRTSGTSEEVGTDA